MRATVPLVTLLDVDNTLLDNDRVTSDLRAHLEREVGPERAKRYWEHFEAIRTELGYADYLGALQRYRNENPRDSHLLTVSTFLLTYPFPDRLYAGAREVVDHVRQWGPAVILSDGDVVFQPHKVQQSGLFRAVAGNVLIYIHKEHELDDVEKRYPAEHYLMVDDKLRLLTAIKRHWSERVTTVFPRQGHYARDEATLAAFPTADVVVDRIGDLLDWDLDALRTAAAGKGH